MPNKEFQVGDTVYEFPDSYDDAKVQGILSKQGVIKAPPKKSEPSFGERAASFRKEHPYISGAAALMFPGTAPVTDPGGEVPKGFAKAAASDIYGLAEFAGPVGMAAHEVAERTGLGKKIRAGTENTGEEKVGGAAETALSMAIPGPAEVKGSKTVARLGKGLRDSAEKGYSQVLNATTKGNKIRSAKVVPELIDRGVMALTDKGLGRKTAKGLSEATERLEDAYANLPPDAAIPVDDVVKSLQSKAADAFKVGGKSMSPQSDQALRLADSLTKRLLSQATTDANGKRVITVDAARKTRQIYDEISKAAGRFEGKALADHSAGVVHGMAADSIRDFLNQVASGKAKIGDLNKEYSFWRNADQVVQDTLLRRQGQARPLGQKLAAGAGAVAGAVHGGPKGAALGYEAMRAVEAATTSAAWRTASAVAKDRLAKALASGNDSVATAAANAIIKGTALGEVRLGK